MWMLYKQRKKPYELKVLEYLDTRMLLSRKERQYYFSLKKGYEGEVLFDSLTEKLQCECFILNDLLLNSNNNTFQIDSLIITSDTIYLFEVKNHAGDYYYESDNFYNKKSNRDRKSTRLNSSHVANSYAVFCLKKKNTKNRRHKSQNSNHDHNQ